MKSTKSNIYFSERNIYTLHYSVWTDNFNNENSLKTAALPQGCLIEEREAETKADQNISGDDLYDEPHRKRSRWSKLNPSSWAKNVQRQRRVKGLDYKSTLGKPQSPNLPKTIDCTKYIYGCSSKISDQYRTELCREYWHLTTLWETKRWYFK